MRLLHVLPSVDPRGGGPIEGVRQRGRCLQRRGHAVELLSLDAPDAVAADADLPVHALGPSSLGSYRYNRRLVPWLREHASRYDAVIVHGLWNYHAFGAWRALRASAVPYYVFVHGMLDPWFKRRYPLKHLKKWLYWPWADYRVLRDAQAVVFTCEQERRLARESFGLYRAREAVASYGTATPPQDAERLREGFFALHPALRGKRLLLFVGRLHEKKGCDLLVEAFARVAASDASLHLVMAGPDQTGWLARLREQAARLGASERITWPGMLQGDAKWGAFHAAEAFVLPSHQENFGIVVAEALGCGVPVLISDQVNIWREVEAARAGLVAPDTLAGCTDLLRRWLALPPAAQAQMRIDARRAFEAHFTVEAMADSLLEILAGRTPTPPTPGLAVERARGAAR
ncbi:MAG TPA: glycosyltransferase [Methylibium sp.]|uniref:glycosyltransferase n=1 Tax=Methylibium sp. TaxID=2067992 RepID=UPI002DBF96E5|nr:glycosyltransferase [Methylibium sp.]HEU4459531.1 glycosyltransferase [Methylibium sp.]